MNYQNLQIKYYAKKNRVLEKDIAKELNISYSTLLVYLRFPLDKDHKEAIKNAVDKIVARRSGSKSNVKEVDK